MANVDSLFNKMVEAQAKPQEKTAEAIEVEEKMEVLSKYASAAQEVLTAEYGSNFTQEDVVKLAGKMIDHDVAIEEQLSKEAEASRIGEVMAEAFVNKINQLTSN